MDGQDGGRAGRVLQRAVRVDDGKIGRLLPRVPDLRDLVAQQVVGPRPAERAQVLGQLEEALARAARAAGEPPQPPPSPRPPSSATAPAAAAEATPPPAQGRGLASGPRQRAPPCNGPWRGGGGGAGRGGVPADVPHGGRRAPRGRWGGGGGGGGGARAGREGRGGREAIESARSERGSGRAA